MTAKTKTNARLTMELLETAKGMHAIGIMNDAAYEQINLRHLKRAATAPAAPPMTGDDIQGRH
jgi:putative transcriptional regulator